MLQNNLWWATIGNGVYSSVSDDIFQGKGNLLLNNTHKIAKKSYIQRSLQNIKTNYGEKLEVPENMPKYQKPLVINRVNSLRSSDPYMRW